LLDHPVSSNALSVVNGRHDIVSALGAPDLDFEIRETTKQRHLIN
jgi:hypothetical protein